MTKTDSTTEQPAHVGVTFLTKCLKAVQPFISKEETRYYLNGIGIDPSGVLIATDGHRLGAIKPVEFFGKCDMFILPADSIKKILSVKPDTKHLPLYVTLDPVAKTATIHHGATADNRMVLASFPMTPIDGTFPDWRRVIPKDEAFEKPAHAGFNANYLSAFASLGEHLKLKLNSDPKGPSVMQGNTSEWEALGVLMPMRTDDFATLPAWVKK